MFKRSTTTALLAVLCTSHVLCGDGVGQDTSPLNGRWDVTEWTIDGRVLPVNSSPDKVWFRIENDDWQWSFVADGKRVTAKLTATLGDETDPNTVDVKVRNGLRPGAVYKGIYRLDDDALKLCFSDDADATRPTTFESTEGSNVQCFVMRRSRSPEHKQPFREVQ